MLMASQLSGFNANGDLPYIGYIGNNSDASSATSYTISVALGTKPWVIIGVVGRCNGSARTLDSATVDSVSATVSATSSTILGLHAAIIVRNPNPGASVNIGLTFSGGMLGVAIVSYEASGISGAVREFDEDDTVVSNAIDIATDTEWATQRSVYLFLAFNGGDSRTCTWTEAGGEDSDFTFDGTRTCSSASWYPTDTNAKGTTNTVTFSGTASQASLMAVGWV